MLFKYKYIISLTNPMHLIDFKQSKPDLKSRNLNNLELISKPHTQFGRVMGPLI